MNIYLDVDLHLAVESIGSRNAISSILLKIEDTPSLNIYLLSGGIVQDYGSSPVLKFALNAAPPAGVSLLVLDTEFERKIDAGNLAFYQGFPLFDTTEMIAALGTLTSFPCVGEIRCLFASGERFSSRDIPFTIWRTLLGDSGSAAPAGTESYPDPALLQLKSEKGENNGYAGLDADGLLAPGVIPIDNASLVIASGKLAVVPASGAGDMTKATYDTANRGYVDRALLSDSATAVPQANVTGLTASLSGKAPMTHTHAQGDVVGLIASLAAKANLLTEEVTSDGQTLIFSTNGVLKRIKAGSGITFDVSTPGIIIINSSGGGTTMILTDAETTSGVTLITDGTAGTLKRLIQGTGITFDTTTTPGGIIISSSGGGGAGAALFAEIAGCAGGGSGAPYVDNANIPFTGIVSDPTGMWASSAPSRLTIATAGVYLISVQVIFSLVAGHFQVAVTKNGNQQFGPDNTVTTGTVWNPCFSGFLTLAPGDYVGISGAVQTGGAPTGPYNNSGPSSLGPGPSPTLSILKVA